MEGIIGAQSRVLHGCSFLHPDPIRHSFSIGEPDPVPGRQYPVPDRYFQKYNTLFKRNHLKCREKTTQSRNQDSIAAVLLLEFAGFHRILFYPVVDDTLIEKNGGAKHENCRKIYERFSHHDNTYNSDFEHLLKNTLLYLF